MPHNNKMDNISNVLRRKIKIPEVFPEEKNLFHNNKLCIFKKTIEEYFLLQSKFTLPVKMHYSINY